MEYGGVSWRKVSVSPIISTYEPMELPPDVERFALGSHRTHSRTALVDHGRETTINRDEFTLTTIICTDSGEREPWRSGRALLVELHYDSDPGLGNWTTKKSKQIELQISGVQYLAGFLGPRNDSFGDWDWTITAIEVPLRLIEETVLGGLRLSGRDLPIPHELRSAGLDEYWKSRLRLLDRYGD